MHSPWTPEGFVIPQTCQGPSKNLLHRDPKKLDTALATTLSWYSDSWRQPVSAACCHSWKNVIGTFNLHSFSHDILMKHYNSLYLYRVYRRLLDNAILFIMIPLTTLTTKINTLLITIEPIRLRQLTARILQQSTIWSTAMQPRNSAVNPITCR